MRCGDGDGADFGKRHQYDPIFVTPLQDHEHAVALCNPHGKKKVGSLVGKHLDVCKRKNPFVIGIVTPNQRALVGIECGVFVHNVVSVIEIFGNVQTEMVVKIVVIFKGNCICETI